MMKTNYHFYLAFLSVMVLTSISFTPIPTSNTDYLTNNNWVLYQSNISPSVFVDDEWITELTDKYDSCSFSQIYYFDDSTLFVIHDTLKCDSTDYRDFFYYWSFYNSESDLILTDFDSISDTLEILLLEEDTLRLKISIVGDTATYQLTQTFVPE